MRLVRERRACRELPDGHAEWANDCDDGRECIPSRRGGGIDLPGCPAGLTAVAAERDCLLNESDAAEILDLVERTDYKGTPGEVLILPGRNAPDVPRSTDVEHGRGSVRIAAFFPERRQRNGHFEDPFARAHFR